MNSILKPISLYISMPTKICKKIIHIYMEVMKKHGLYPLIMAYMPYKSNIYEMFVHIDDARIVTSEQLLNAALSMAHYDFLENKNDELLNLLNLSNMIFSSITSSFNKVFMSRGLNVDGLKAEMLVEVWIQYKANYFS